MIIRVLKEYLRKRRLKRYSHFFSKDPSAILLPWFTLRFDNPDQGRNYLKLGGGSIIGGTFIFESNEGFVEIGDNTFVGGSTFISRNRISVGSNVHIAWGSTIYDHDSHSINYLDRRKDMHDQMECLQEGLNIAATKDWSLVKTAPIVIKDDAWIGMNCIILKGVSIGRGAVIGAGSVVTHDVPDWCLAAGNPARIIKQIPH